MTEIKSAFFGIDNLKRKLLPFLLVTTINSAIVSIYLGTVLTAYIPAIAILTVVLFAAYDFIKTHKWIGPVVFIGICAVVLCSISMLMTAERQRFEFFEWFLSGGELVDTQPAYLWIIVIGFTFFISSVVYYFTHISYRVSIITLICIIPLAIYVKTSQVIPGFYIGVLAALDILVYIYQNRIVLEAKNVPIGKNAALTSYIDFAGAVILIALIVPKPQETPYYEKFEEFSAFFSLRGTYGQMSGSYTSSSGNADNYQNMESKLLYTVNTNVPQYMKIQVFDTYVPENNHWVYSDSYNRGYKNWINDASAMSYSSLFEAYKILDSELLDKLKPDAEGKISAAEDSLLYARVSAVEFPAKYVISPLRAANVTFPNNDAEFTYRTAAGEIYPNTKHLSPYASYGIDFYDSAYVFSSGWLESGLCDITMDEYEVLLDEYETQLFNMSDNAEPYTAVSGFYNDCYEAQIFAPSNYDKVSDELQHISDEITAGLTYDWEKAAAIEQYFRTNGFRYDLAYRAPEGSDTPEFFLTESKRGTCSDFATAYCLLARGAGLTVRYVEGFVPAATEISGAYQIYTENAHAYPEVFIPGAGWVIYEPTVGGVNTSGTSDSSDKNTETDYLAVFITCIAVFVSAAAVIVIIIFLPKLEKTFFILRVRHTAPNKAVLMLYKRFLTETSRIFNVKCRTMTVEQVRAFVESKTGFSLEPLTAPFEAVCYGGADTDKAAAFAALECYKAQLKSLRRYKHQK